MTMQEAFEFHVQAPEAPPRRCRTCDEVKPAAEFWRHKESRSVHCQDCMRVWHRERYHRTNGKDKVFDASLRRNYGITLEQYNQMAEDQGHVCAICGEAPPSAKRMHVDHDHATGKVRAILCRFCNHMLGNARDSIPRLRQAIAYLELHSNPSDNGATP